MIDRPAATAAVEAKGITKVFPGTTALGGVDFSVFRGRVHALIGENGAGKSTLVNILGGVMPPTSGSLLLDGDLVNLHSIRDAAERGIHIIHQELQLFQNLSVADNLFVGRERTNGWGVVDRDAEASMAHDALMALGQSIDPRTLVDALPLGQRQIVEIARALVHDTQVLMMDEPTSALTAAEIDVLFGVIRDLASRGVAIVYISHRLEELLALADTVTVLCDGRVAGEAPASDIDVPWIVDRMTGGTFARREGRAAATAGRVLLSVQDMTLPPRAGRSGLAGVTFELRSGEVIGVYGLMGAGRTELFESILGLHSDAGGRVELEDEDVTGLDVHERVAAGLFMVPEDRQAAGLIPTLSVRANMTLSNLDRVSVGGYLSPAREADAAGPLVSDLRIKMPGLDAPVTALSGGNQQKVIIARGLMSRPRVLLLDEPTRGVDVAAKAEIIEAMQRLAAGGLGVLFATSDLAEVHAAAGRTLVMAGGRITADFAAGDATDASLTTAASAGMVRVERSADARG
jgi:erythritol transport system ATP-binding protein